MNDVNELLQEAKDAVGPGWWPIIDKYLPPIVELAPNCFINAKEKFGLLRIQCYGPALDREKIIKLEREAEIVSSTVCEECGASGKHRHDLDWMQTLCEPCYQACKNK